VLKAARFIGKNVVLPLEKKGFQMLEEFGKEEPKRSPMELITPRVSLPGEITLQQRETMNRLKREANPEPEKPIDLWQDRAKKFGTRFIPATQL